MSRPVILDLDYGNTRSIALAFERLGAEPVLSADPAVAARADHLVLPGVGAAGAAMKRIRDSGLDRLLAERTSPTLGICLGMQLLFEDSAEDGGTALLGILPGRVAPLAPSAGYPVPHMGWSALDNVAAGLGLGAGDYAYFAHSFVCPDSKATVARTHYGETPVPAALRLGPLWGAQFHPERSSDAGARFLRAFLES